MSVLTRFLPVPPPAPPLLVLAGDCFFVRQVAIVPGEAVGPQVRLALEGMSPFPPEQLYYGAVPAPDGASALVFGAYRRRFSAAELEAWAEAAVVTPEFVPLCTAPAANTGGFIRLLSGTARLTALAWQPGTALPSLVLTRAATSADAAAFLEDVRSRAGLSAEAGVQTLEGELSGRVGAGGEVAFTCGDAQLPAIPLEWFAAADVRDPDFLSNRRRGAVRDLWLWRTLLATAALLALAALLELGAGALRWQSNRREALVKAQSEDVKQIDTAQALANRIGELSKKRLMPFEMLAAINPARPDSVVFQRTITRGLHGLEIEAQAGNAEDVGTYSSALRALPVLAEVKTREVRARDGVTSFVLALQFKPEAFRDGGGL
jgi:hypothetical protein